MGKKKSAPGRAAHERIVERLRSQADDVRRLTSGLDEKALSTRTVPEKWSVKEILCHLWRIQEVFDKRLDALLTKEKPEIVSYEPEGDSEFPKLTALSARRAHAAFQKGRTRLLARLEKLQPGQWHRAGRHVEFPHYDVHFAMEYMAHHEAHHIYQMFQRRAPLAKVPH
jgi:hypothetical protein